VKVSQFTKFELINAGFYFYVYHVKI